MFVPDLFVDNFKKQMEKVFMQPSNLHWKTFTSFVLSPCLKFSEVNRIRETGALNHTLEPKVDILCRKCSHFNSTAVFFKG